MPVIIKMILTKAPWRLLSAMCGWQVAGIMGKINSTGGRPIARGWDRCYRVYRTKLSSDRLAGTRDLGVYCPGACGECCCWSKIKTRKWDWFGHTLRRPFYRVSVYIPE